MGRFEFKAAFFFLCADNLHALAALNETSLREHLPMSRRTKNTSFQVELDAHERHSQREEAVRSHDGLSLHTFEDDVRLARADPLRAKLTIQPPITYLITPIITSRPDLRPLRLSSLASHTYTRP